MTLRTKDAEVETIYDWITMGLFAALVTLFLHRSAADEPRDSIWSYLLACVGCALANWLGNEDLHIAAIAALGATVAYIHFALRPLGGRRL